MTSDSQERELAEIVARYKRVESAMRLLRLRMRELRQIGNGHWSRAASVSQAAGNVTRWSHEVAEEADELSWDARRRRGAPHG
jgi:hypothetical protein